MMDGIYYVHFEVHAAASTGDGLVVIKDGMANGGDAGYTYSGAFEEHDGRLAASLTVKRWNPAHVSVFGNLAEFQLQLSGSAATASGFALTGGTASAPGYQISITGRRVADAA